MKLLQDPEHIDIHIILCSRNKLKGKETINSILNEIGFEQKSRIELCVIDVNDQISIQNAATYIKNKYQQNNHDTNTSTNTPIYGLINNAGVGYGPTFKQIIDTNLRGLINVTNSFLPLIQMNGRIINISSASGPMFVNKLEPSDQMLFNCHNTHTGTSTSIDSSNKDNNGSSDGTGIDIDIDHDWNRMEEFITKYTKQSEQETETGVDNNIAYGKYCVCSS